jgi:RNA polymerase sigma-70 factor (ECF subfamily)
MLSSPRHEHEQESMNVASTSVVPIGVRFPDRTEVFVALIQPLLQPAFALAMAMLGDRQAAEDAVQEAALKAWRNASKVAGSSAPPRSWFLTIVANQCRDTRRARWWQVLRLDEMPETRQSDHAERVNALLDLDRAMARLSREQRALVYLRYHLDMQPKEISTVLSLRQGTVKSRLHRALRRLQTEMTPGSKEETDD